MASLRDRLDKIRKPEERRSIRSEVAVSIVISLSGVLIGIFQKWIDSMASNELPMFFQQIDIVNFMGRLAIWILIAVCISVYAKTPLRASLNTFLFLISMVAGYYVYCNFVLGFLPVSYMMIWVAAAFLSIPLAYICWYAKGEGMPAVVISAGILGVLLAQGVILTQGIYVTHMTEVVTWLIGAAVLYRKPKEYAVVMALSVVFAVIYQMFIPYWG
jgi:hypothetical protein